MSGSVGGKLVFCCVHSPYNGGDHPKDIAGLSVGRAMIERERGVMGAGLVNGE